MKYVVVLGDGMADEPLEKLGGLTPLAYADTPMMDQLAGLGEIGMVHTVPEGMSPGSDTANLSVLGYDPRKYYSGRSPLEALSIGVPLKEEDVALRCNLVTLSEEEDAYEKRRMIDHSSSEISTEDAAILMEAVSQGLRREGYTFHVGTSYRHLLVINGGEVMPLVQPHDILGKVIGGKLPENAILYDMMKKSYDILVQHPLNEERRARGLHPANSCWFWGAGTKPALSSFADKTGKSGAMISAVDLLKGIAIGSGMKVVTVEGANGGLHTNYEGKAAAAVDVLRESCDFVYIHVEAPDEMGHQGSAERKIEAIEYLDQRIVRPVCEGLEDAGEAFRMLILPDHPTPVGIRTHTGDSVPYLLYDSSHKQEHTWKYNEAEARMSGNYIAEGHKLIDRLLEV